MHFPRALPAKMTCVMWSRFHSVMAMYCCCKGRPEQIQTEARETCNGSLWTAVRLNSVFVAGQHYWVVSMLPGYYWQVAAQLPHPLLAAQTKNTAPVPAYTLQHAVFSQAGQLVIRSSSALAADVESWPSDCPQEGEAFPLGLCSRAADCLL